MLFYVSSDSGVVAVNGLAAAVIIAGLLLCVVAMAVIIQLRGPCTYKQRIERTMIYLHVNINVWCYIEMMRQVSEQNPT